MSYHAHPDHYRRVVKLIGLGQADPDRGGVWVGRGAFFVVPARPPKPRTHSVDRTRSPRWRAGSRRTKKLARLARQQGRRTPFADPWKGWADLGWTTDGGVSENLHVKV